MRIALIAAIAALALAGCKPGGPFGPSFDDASAASQIKTLLEGRTYNAFTERLPCTRYFAIEHVYIIDRKISGDQAEVSAQAVIRSNTEIGATSWAAMDCFSPPQQGWHPGTGATMTQTYKFERWQSGWRLVS